MSYQVPPEPTPGQPIPASWGRLVCLALRALKPPVTTHTPRPRGGATAAAPVHPFQAMLSDTSDPAAPKITINGASRLFRGLSSVIQTIDGLSAERTLAADTKVWLQVAVSGLETNGASIQHGAEMPNLTTIADGAQTQFVVPIGQVRVGTYPLLKGFAFTINGAAHHFEQLADTHLLVETLCLSGTPGIYAFPWGGAPT